MMDRARLPLRQLGADKYSGVLSYTIGASSPDKNAVNSTFGTHVRGKGVFMRLRKVLRALRSNCLRMLCSDVGRLAGIPRRHDFRTCARWAVADRCIKVLATMSGHRLGARLICRCSASRTCFRADLASLVPSHTFWQSLMKWSTVLFC